MRIAYITADPGVPVFGQKGCSIHVQEVLRALAKRGANIDLFATNCSRGREQPAPSEAPKNLPFQIGGHEVDERLGLANIRVHPLTPAPKGDSAFREQKCLAANERIRGLLESEGPFDVIYERYSLWSFAGMEHARATAT